MGLESPWNGKHFPIPEAQKLQKLSDVFHPTVGIAFVLVNFFAGLT